MTRFLYLLSLLKKEKKRKKGTACLFNFRKMDKKVISSMIFVTKRNQNYVLIFLSP